MRWNGWDAAIMAGRERAGAHFWYDDTSLFGACFPTIWSRQPHSVKLSTFTWIWQTSCSFTNQA
jgi:hypothetical protein